jgi:protein subunit release factor B
VIDSLTMAILSVLQPRVCTAVQRVSFLKRFLPVAFLSSKSMPARIKIPETDIQESFLKGSGPGGQKIVS